MSFILIPWLSSLAQWVIYAQSFPSSDEWQPTFSWAFDKLFPNDQPVLTAKQRLLSQLRLQDIFNVLEFWAVIVIFVWLSTLVGCLETACQRLRLTTVHVWKLVVICLHEYRRRDCTMGIHWNEYTSGQPSPLSKWYNARDYELSHSRPSKSKSLFPWNLWGYQRMFQIFCDSECEWPVSGIIVFELFPEYVSFQRMSLHAYDLL